MFLGVSGRVLVMPEMDDEQRIRLGRSVRQARMERFTTKIAAYQAAGINSATWDRIEAGESVRDHSLIPVIKLLWPPTGGDWQKVPGVKYDTFDYSVFGDGLGEDYPRLMERWVMELQERIELLEQHVYDKKKDGPDAQPDPAPSTRAGGSPAPDMSVGDYTLAASDDEDAAREFESHEDQP
jgi:hypothetical protein